MTGRKQYVVTYTTMMIDADSPEDAIAKADEVGGGGNWEAEEVVDDNLSPADRLRTGVGTLTIKLDGHDASVTLLHIVDLIEQGMTSGYYPTWEVSA